VLAAGLLGGLIAFWIQDLSGWEEVASSLFFWTIAGVAVALRSSDNAATDTRVGNRRIVTALAIVAAAALAAVSWATFHEVEIDTVLHAASQAPAREWPATVRQMDRIRPLIGADSAYLDRMAIVYLNRMRLAPDGGTYTTAIDLTRRANDANRFDPSILIHFVDAETLALLSRMKRAPAADAIEAADRLGTLDPHNASARETVARFRLATGSGVAALREVRFAIELRPHRQGLRLLEGDIQRALGDQAAALAAYRAEAAMHAGADPIWVAAQQKVTASLLAAGDHAGALREAQLLTTKVPADPVGQQLLEAAGR
jgi:tetratricopeptide (TPR) repeat protein